MHAYLSWEIDLVNEIVRDGTVQFGAPGFGEVATAVAGRWGRLHELATAEPS